MKIFLSAFVRSLFQSLQYHPTEEAVGLEILERIDFTVVCVHCC